jgi:serine/threonine protein kinase
LAEIARQRSRQPQRGLNALSAGEDPRGRAVLSGDAGFGAFVSSTTRIGTTVAGYRLEALLGRGGMSVVYLAEHLRLGRKVALKLLVPALSHDESFRERFERESRRAAEIDHPNIIPIYDAGEFEGQLYIAMRYVNGADLKTVLEREGALGLGRTLFILEQAASALDAAHDRALVHRDVKPANILIEQPSEHVYLTDFGIVKHTAASQGLTRTGLFIGTVDYAAPEQIEGMGVDVRTDVYALGCVLFECLTGRAPFDREGEVAVMHAHLTESPPLVTAVKPDLPKALDQVVARAMAKDPAERYERCEELVAAARAAVLGRPSTAARLAVDPPVTTAEPPPGPPAEASPAEPPSSAPPAAEAAPAQAPEAAAPVQPPAPPPAAPASGRGRGDRGRLVLVAALAATLAAAGAAVAVYFATRSDSSDRGQEAAPQVTVTEPAPPVSPAEPVSPPGETATTPAPADASAPQLVALVPSEIWQDCTPEETPLLPGATESAVCVPPSGASRRFERVELSIFPDGASLASAYDSYVASAGVPADSGRCGAATWGGEGAWEHGPGNAGGRRLCYFDGNQALIVWTHEKLEQENHVDTLGLARIAGGDHSELYTWWNFWHHLVGRQQDEG